LLRCSAQPRYSSRRRACLIPQSNTNSPPLPKTKPRPKPPLPSQPTRAHSHKLEAFYGLRWKEATAYSAYATTTTFLPACVAAAVLYYGGTLVLSGHVRSGVGMGGG